MQHQGLLTRMSVSANLCVTRFALPKALQRLFAHLLSTAALARLEEFHLCVAHRMAKSAYHVGDGTIGIYPPSDKVLEECGMHTIQHNIDVQRQTIAKYVVNCSIFMECQGADRRHDSVPRWW
jgi:hypothetical protein